jgi:UDP-2,3-diacylglucosamine pyrophosphatase LpxH
VHIFLSDLHMTDSGAAGAVSDAELAAFVERLERRSGSEREKITLVFVGDVLDLLRSPKWERLWTTQNRSAPWSGMNKGFRNFQNGHAERCAVEIATAIRGRYASFSAALKRLVEAGRIETAYVFGNHDYMVQLSAKLRAIVVDLLALSHDPNKKFKLTYSSVPASVFATHGHSVDSVNWHRETEGYWAIGDAIVLRIVNRFATAACSEIGCSLETEVGQLLQEIDNIEPLSDIPLFVRWLIEESLTIKSARKHVEKVWRQVVEEFLAIEDFQDKNGYGAGSYHAIRQAFKLSTHLNLADFFAKLPALFPSGGTDYRSAAAKQAQTEKRYRFVLFGHTHKPMLVPLAVSVRERTFFYVNTGCWRRLVTRASETERGPFAGRRVASYFQIDGTEDGSLQERYHLYQEWHAS